MRSLPPDPFKVRFANDSERRLAEMFDVIGTSWLYEPVEFILHWDEVGRARSAFRPDFYLPEHDLFVELTTMRQQLVTQKNRKLRRLRELHPEINATIFYRRDFLRLAEPGFLVDLLKAPQALTVEAA